MSINWCPHNMDERDCAFCMPLIGIKAMTPKVPLLSEEMRAHFFEQGVAEQDGTLTCDCADSLSMGTVHSWLAKVAALERQLDRGVEGLVPRYWELVMVTQPSDEDGDGTGQYIATLAERFVRTPRIVEGTGPTVEAAVRNAAEKVTP